MHVSFVESNMEIFNSILKLYKLLIEFQYQKVLTIPGQKRNGQPLLRSEATGQMELNIE